MLFHVRARAGILEGGAGWYKRRGLKGASLGDRYLIARALPGRSARALEDDGGRLGLAQAGVRATALGGAGRWPGRMVVLSGC